MEPRTAHRRPPLATATLIAACYGVACAAYIVVSGRIVAAYATSIDHLERLETIKGITFIAATTIVIFVLVWLLYSLVERRELVVEQHRSALIEAERRAVASVLAASVAHDINNVLTVLGADVETLTRGAAPRSATERIAHTVENLGVLSRRLMDAGRSSLPGRPSRCDLVAVVAATAELARRHVALRHAHLSVTGDEHVPITANTTLVEQMVLNLILNAGEATGGVGRIQVRVRSDGDDAVIEVHDDGPGVDERTAKRLFEPFFTSKVRGSGLGLLAVRSCADVHGGTVEVARSPLGGALFRVRLRSLDASAAPGAGEAATGSRETTAPGAAG